MLIELHCHTSRHSRCSRIDPVALIRRAQEKNLQGVVITEHHYLWGPEELDELRSQAELDRYFLLLSAQEVSTDSGHVLVFGVPETIQRKARLADLRRDYPGAALVWAHPWRSGAEPPDERLTSPFLDGVEVFSSNHGLRENCRALTRWHRLKFTATAGSDAHEVPIVGTLPTYFDHPIGSVEELAEEIRHNRCRPYLKETIGVGRNSFVTKLSIGTKGVDEKRYRLVLRRATDDRHFDRLLRRATVMETLHGHGFARGRFRVPALLHVDREDRLVIERGVRGKSLRSVLPHASREAGYEAYRLSAGWLASLHRKALHLTGRDASIGKERSRFQSYRRNAECTRNPRAREITETVDFVQREEERLFADSKEPLVQCHGDFQPNNILIGQDRSRDYATRYVAAIDFGSSYEFPPAFDIGYFLAQFGYQFKQHPRVLERYREKHFIREYLTKYGTGPTDGFRARIDLFRIRANLSIVNFLILVGKGESDDVAELVGECVSLREEVAGS